MPHLDKLVADAGLAPWLETDIFLAVVHFEKMAGVAAQMRRKVLSISPCS